MIIPPKSGTYEVSHDHQMTSNIEINAYAHEKRDKKCNKVKNVDHSIFIIKRPNFLHCYTILDIWNIFYYIRYIVTNDVMGILVHRQHNISYSLSYFKIFI